MVRSYSLDKRVIVLAMVMVLASEAVKLAGMTFSAVDLAGAVMALAAVIMVCPGCEKVYGTSFSQAVYGGLFAGFALGCKVTFASIVGVLFCWLLFSNEQNNSIKKRFYFRAVEIF